MSTGLGKNWFSEVNPQWPGQCMSLEIDEMLWDKKSKFQHVQVFKSKTWGNVLVLDGVIQLTTRDEMSYQEMITHIPMFSHPNPESVCIVGGGDGGVIREVLKHKCVKHVTICEIDQMVIDVGKMYFPTVASAWDDKRVKLVCDDAAKFMASAEVKESFDVIVCDSSDPVGPAGVLFESAFYRNMWNALKPGGRVSTQGESMWINLKLISGLLNSTKNMFANVDYATTQIPTYPAGQIGFILCTKQGGSVDPQFKIPTRKPDKDMEAQLTYYSSELHSAAFVLPAFVARVVREAKEGKQEEKKEEKKASKEEEAKAAKPAASEDVKMEEKKEEPKKEEAKKEEKKEEEEEEASKKKGGKGGKKKGGQPSKKRGRH